MPILLRVCNRTEWLNLVIVRISVAVDKYLIYFQAGVRALDTMNDLVQNKKGMTVDRFLVAGASKVI